MRGGHGDHSAPAGDLSTVYEGAGEGGDGGVPGGPVEVQGDDGGPRGGQGVDADPAGGLDDEGHVAVEGREGGGPALHGAAPVDGGPGGPEDAREGGGVQGALREVLDGGDHAIAFLMISYLSGHLRLSSAGSIT